MTFNRRTLLGTGLAAAVTACAGPAATGRLRIGFQRNGILYVARSRGDIDKRLQARGVALEWVEFPSGPPLVEALNAGAIDLGAVGDSPLVYAQAAAVDVKLVAGQIYRGQTAGNAFLTLPRAPIATVAALKGKRIGFTKGSSAEVAALSALHDAGLGIGDVTPVTLAPGDGVAALGQGSIDALFTWDPYFTIAQSRLHASETRFDRAGLLTVTLYIARSPVIASNGQALHGFLDALRAEAAWANGHLPVVQQQLAAATRLPVPDMARVIGRLGPQPFHVDPPDTEILANQQRVADVLFDAGAIRKRLDVNLAADRSWRPV